MTEGGSQSWIGLTTETAHYIYWQDGSYVSKAEQKATKVKYSGNHSAVITSTPLVYESKWGCWPLMQHAPMYVPTGYGGPSAFYVRVLKSSINGPGCLVQGNNGYYAAYATGGKPPYSYSWQYRIDCDLESREFRMEGPPCGVWNHAGSGQQIYFGASQTQNFSIRATAYDNSDQSAISYNMYVHVQPFSCLSGALTSGDVPVNEQKAFLSSNTTRQSQPQAFDLDQNHPNPFNPITEVRFSLPEAAHVLLTIYDVVGRELARLVDQQTDAGYHTVTWDASNVPSGLYLCRFQANGFVKTQRMILLK